MTPDLSPRAAAELRLPEYVGPGRPFSPVSDPAACPDCRRWEATIERVYSRDYADLALDLANPEREQRLNDRVDLLDERLADHRELHRCLGYLPADERRHRFFGPAWESWHGIAVLKSPVGSTEQGKAFLLLNRHRFGAFARAGIFTYEATDWPLRLSDEEGKQIWLAGMTAGYGGEGPHGTVWALRLAGFRDAPDPDEPTYGRSRLERLVFGNKYFTLDRGDDDDR